MKTRLDSRAFPNWSNPPGSTRRAAWLIPAFLAATLLSGCLSRPSPSLNTQSFSFAIPPITTAKSSPHGHVLAIRRLNVAAPFDQQSFLYRTGEFSYERDPYAQFLVAPAQDLMGPIRGYFRQSGLFSAVTELGSALQPNTVVEITANQIYGDFRRRTAPGAVLSLSFVFFDTPNGLPGRVLLQKSYTRRVPLKTRTAAALMAGWNEALAEIMREVDADLKKDRVFSPAQTAPKPQKAPPGRAHARSPRRA